MKINDNFTDPERSEVQQGNAAGNADRKSDTDYFSRRRALLAGLAAAPVMLTIFGRSAFAQTQTVNCSVARSVLAGTSLHPGITQYEAKNNNTCSM